MRIVPLARPSADLVDGGIRSAIALAVQILPSNGFGEFVIAQCLITERLKHRFMKRPMPLPSPQPCARAHVEYFDLMRPWLDPSG